MWPVARNFDQYIQPQPGKLARMIARLWSGRAQPAKAADYARHFTGVVVPRIRQLAGHRGAWLLRRDSPGVTEFLTVTLWESRDSIMAFAGNDIDHAHVEPEGRAALDSFDDFARHYEMAFTSS